MTESHLRSDPVTNKLIAWATQEAQVRSMLITSNRANPNASTDLYSDYDVILVVEDIYLYFQNRQWLDVFGKVIVTYWDDIYRSATYGSELLGSVIQYDDLRIDFTLWPVDLLQKVVDSSTLPDDLDVRYRILVDKDDLASGLIPATYEAYIPKPPTAEAFHRVVEDFLSIAPSAAKYLRREELLPVKWCLEYDMKHNFLRRMLEWRVGIDHHWSVPVGSLDKGLKDQLPPEIWAAVEQTYVGASIEENWDALLHTLEVFQQLGSDVAARMSLSYPDAMHEDVVTYVNEVRKRTQ